MNKTNHDFSSAFFSESHTIRDAIQALDDNSLKILIVVDVQHQIQGTITDGDIRRGLLEGLNLESSANLIMNSSPIVAESHLTKDDVRQLMQAHGILQIPMVNKEKQIIGIHFWDELDSEEKIEKTMVVMAGGLGTRLKELTANCPKPLLPVAGKPILEHIIDRAKFEGFNKFLISIHHLGDMIVEHFGDGTNFGVQIEYIREDTPLGTAGALSLINEIPDDPLVVTNGDVLTGVSYGELLSYHSRNNASITMAVTVQETQLQFGVVNIEGNLITGYEEKPLTRLYLNAGVYVLNPNVLEALKPGTKIDMPEMILNWQSAGNKVIAFPLHERWIDIGRPGDYQRADSEIFL